MADTKVLTYRGLMFTKRSPMNIRIPAGRGILNDLFPVFACHPALSF
jgi:hypothetical protein